MRRWNLLLKENRGWTIVEVLISILIGLIIFILPMDMPNILSKTVEMLANLNTPVAMILLGSYLSKIDFKDMLLNLSLYHSVIMRLIIIPATTVLIIKFAPIGDVTAKLIAILAASTPVGSNIAVFAQQHDKDYVLSVKITCLSTVLSIVTIPIIFYIANKFIY